MDSRGHGESDKGKLSYKLMAEDAYLLLSELNIEEVKEEQKAEGSKIPYDEEEVEYTAPITYGIEEDDIYVGVRGKRYQIKRGETVMIPRYVLWVIQAAQRQEAVAQKTIRKTVEKGREAFAKM